MSVSVVQTLQTRMGSREFAVCSIPLIEQQTLLRAAV